MRRPAKLDPWVASFLDDKAKRQQQQQQLAASGAESEHHTDYIDPRLDPHDPYFDPRFARLYQQQHLEAERKAQHEHAKMLEIEKEKEQLRQDEERVRRLEEQESQVKYADRTEMQRKTAGAQRAALRDQARREGTAREQSDIQASLLHARRREEAAEEHIAHQAVKRSQSDRQQAAAKDQLRRRALVKEQADRHANAVARDQLARHEHDLKTREGIEARKRELQRAEQHMLELQKAEAAAEVRARYDKNLEQVQKQLMHVEKLEKVLDDEERADHLAALLQSDPGALVKGLDLHAFIRDPSLVDDPRLLEKALELVNTNLQSGVSPMQPIDRGDSRSRSPRPPPPSSPSPAPRQHLARSSFPPSLLGDFINTEQAAQELCLRRIEDKALRRHFLQQVVAAAADDEADELYERYHHLDYDLDLFMRDASERSTIGVRTPVPDIVIDRVRSPPTNQDHGPHIFQRFVDDIVLQPEQFVSPTPSPAPAQAPFEGVRQPSPHPLAVHQAVAADRIASDTGMPGLHDLTLPRTSAAYPSGLAGVEVETMSERAEEAAAVKRELQEIADGEARLASTASSPEGADPLSLKNDALAAVQPSIDMAAESGFFEAAQAESVSQPSPKAMTPKAATPKAATPKASVYSPGAKPYPGSTLPTPPAPFMAASPPQDRFASPKGNLVWSPRAPVPMPDLGNADIPALSTSPGCAAGDAAAILSSPRLSRLASMQGTPKSPKARSPIVFGSPPLPPQASSARGSVLASPTGRSTRSGRSVASPKPVFLPSVVDVVNELQRMASPTPTIRSAARSATPPVTQPLPAMISPEKDAHDSAIDGMAAVAAAKSPSTKSSTSAKSSRLVSRVQSKGASPASSVRQETSESPSSTAQRSAILRAASKKASPTIVSPKPNTPFSAAQGASPSRQKIAVASPLQDRTATFQAVTFAAQRSPTKSVRSTESPGLDGAPAASMSAIAAGQTSAAEVWTIPAAQAGTGDFLTSPRQFASQLPETWSSPARAASPRDSTKQVSPVGSFNPDAAAPMASGAWGSPQVQASRTPVAASPALSRAKSHTSGKSTVRGIGSPAFGLNVSPKNIVTPAAHDACYHADEEHQTTATKGSDPVVISMAQQLSSKQANHDMQHAREHDDEHGYEGEHPVFVFEDFLIFRDNEPLDEGMHVDMVDHMPHQFAEAYPKASQGVTPEALEHYFAQQAL